MGLFNSLTAVLHNIRITTELNTLVHPFIFYIHIWQNLFAMTGRVVLS